MKDHFLAQALSSGQAWGMTPEGLEALQGAAQSGKLPTPPESAAGLPTAAEGLQAGMLMGGNQAAYLTRLLKDTMPNGKSIALVDFAGTIISRAPAWAGGWGYLSPQLFASTMTALADNVSVGAIVLVMDCNGGTVSGTVDAAEAVAYAAKKKKVYAVAADMCLSAAYWIACQASQIIATPTALVGSIGVITSHADYSKALESAGVVVTFIRSVVNKARGQAYEPLTAEALAERQNMVNVMHGQFEAAVQRGRKVSKAKVQSWTGNPLQSVWVGSEAVSAGLADRAASLGTLLAELTGKQAAPAAVAPAPEQQAPDPAQDEADAALPVGLVQAGIEGAEIMRAASAATADAPAAAEATAVAVQDSTMLQLTEGQPYRFNRPSGMALALLDSLGVTLASAGADHAALVYTPASAGLYALIATALPAEQQPGAALSSAQVTEVATVSSDQSKSTGGNQNDATQSEDKGMNIKEIIAKVNAGQSITAEEQAALTAHLDSQRAGAAAAVDTSKLDPAVARALADSQARAERAETALAAKNEAEAVTAAENKAVELGQPKAFGATYRKIADALGSDAAALAAYEQSVRATGAQAELSAEIGNSQRPAAQASGTPEQQMNAKAQAKITESKGVLTFKAACEAVLAEDREFAVRYAQGR